MANTTFSGPVISKNGFITTGPGATKTINSTGLGASGLALTVNAHAGRILISQDADGIYALPSINASANGATAGATDYNNPNNIGASFYFYIDTLATDVQIITDGTDKFTGAAMIAVDDGSKKAFFPGASNDVCSLNGTTQGGIVGSVLQVTALETAQYLVHNTLLLGSGSIQTPFSDT
tara:strand:+ start:125 stop:661 length:537 start_codon:yes stop_codon:yes gene_type:complete